MNYFAGDTPILLVAALPRWDIRDFRAESNIPQI
jgi:hypothetical protein